MLCVSGQKSGGKIREAFKFVPVLRNALEGLVQHDRTLSEMSLALRELGLPGPRVVAMRQSEEKGGTMMDKVPCSKTHTKHPL